MNTKIILAGSLTIAAAFSIALFFLLGQRKQQLNTLLNNQLEPQNQRVFKATVEDLSPESRIAAKKETYSLNILLRGTIISVNTQENLLSLLAIKKDDLGNKTEEIIDLNFSKINQVLCWPEFVNTTSGNQIDIKESFFPLEKDSILLLNNQEIATPSLINQSIVGKFIFVYLTDTEYPNNTNPIAKQIAVLNCPK